MAEREKKWSNCPLLQVYCYDANDKIVKAVYKSVMGVGGGVVGGVPDTFIPSEILSVIIYAIPMMPRPPFKKVGAVIPPSALEAFAQENKQWL